ncbi:MAG: hypothetical protein COS92_05630 [Desulfobacterales bacterium CG07_land_8_20_14_0_80_52_14]|nr:MAG: hypothetical protein COX20_12570 [Desulfobacterales bacterium CG23_combo_of_CG06-09_8_20_14_all_52_9]PIU49643.1 MAG: hypothetical protein COS92_05630 [Desulfobacterales bacterium CG07_land_8_20_14_0_80_52_14]
MISETKIRRLTDKGVEEFRSYLSALHSGTKDPPPHLLLNDPKHSETVENGVIVSDRHFNSRLEAAIYLDGVLSGIKTDAIETDVHLWSWLSLFYFEQVCPLEKNGMRRPGRDYRHILEPGYRYGHNHLLCGAYLVYTIHGLKDKLSALLLHTPLNVESGFHHQLAQRQNFISNKGIMEAAYLLYFDVKRQRPKPGSSFRKNPGNLFRFIDVLQQFDLTYDLYSMSGPEILRILPYEFDKWKERRFFLNSTS